jgi:cytochrome d ubiquinol oxidase, subunit II
MKNVTILGLAQALLSLISGVLISKMSFIGKIGISTMYREYIIFKTWWKTALLLLVIQLVLIAVLQLFRTKVSVSFSRLLAFLLIVLGGIGAYFTYIDFTTTSHKMMKLSFHLGFYLFWVGWFITCFYYLLFKKKKKEDNIQQDILFADTEAGKDIS